MTNQQNLADYVIEVKLSSNIFSWAGEVLDLLKECAVAPGKIVIVQKKFIAFLHNIDTRKFYGAGKMLRHIVNQETDGKIHLKLLKENGGDLK